MARGTSSSVMAGAGNGASGTLIGDPVAPLRNFVVEMTRLVERTNREPDILREGEALLARLVAQDDWLPERFAQPHPQFYQQYLLHSDPYERFCVVSFVWGPGQETPVHDHTVWGLVGVLRGAERALNYVHENGQMKPNGEVELLRAGEVAMVSPSIGDIHAVSNAFDDRSSISIHVYGGNIGAIHRHVFDRETGAAKAFVSGYSAEMTPNLWDRSAQIRALLEV
ncbi:cysteine dioxygenase [Xanthobacter sp. TB0139]|uniref:cysteine dioxygenase n=1 Tax=Xanthobacter sp. TB0139 TaxID=3459178 RepID=UPI004039AAAE